MKKILLFLVGVLLYSCSASKASYKRGVELENAGMYKEAAESYLKSVELDKENMEAIIALKRVGSKIYQEYMTETSKSAKQGDNKGAVYSYLAGEDLREKAQKLGVSIAKDKITEGVFNDSKKAYSEEILQKGNNLIAEDKFREAHVYFTELVKLNPENEKYKDLSNVALSEPIYRNANKSMESNKYRDGYNLFSTILNYKDSKKLREHCLEKALFKIVMLPIKNNSDRYEIVSKFQDNVIKEIFEKKDPFLSLLDQAQMRNILNDRGIDINEFEGNNPKFLNSMSQIFGVKAFLKCTVVSVKTQEAPEKKETKTGYERYSIEETDPKTRKKTTKTQFRKADYTLISASNTIMITFSFNLVSSTGEILASSSIAKEAVSSVRYGTTTANIDNMYSSPNTQNSISDLFRGSRDLKSFVTLENEAVSIISKEVASKLVSYNPEK